MLDLNSYPASNSILQAFQDLTIDERFFWSIVELIDFIHSEDVTHCKCVLKVYCGKNETLAES